MLVQRDLASGAKAGLHEVPEMFVRCNQLARFAVKKQEFQSAAWTRDNGNRNLRFGGAPLRHCVYQRCTVAVTQYADFAGYCGIGVH